MNAKRRTLLERYSVFVVAAFAIATPFMFRTAFLAVQTKTNKVSDWLPKSYTETADLKWFRDHFVADQFVVVSWNGCRLGDDPARVDAEPDDPRIERLARMLAPNNDPAKVEPDGVDNVDAERPADDFANAFGSPHFFKSVTTGRRLLNRLTSDKSDLEYAAAVNRLKGSLIGPDGHQTCVVVTLSDDAIDRFRDVIGRGSQGWLRFKHPEGALFTAIRLCGIEAESVHIGGPPVDSVSIDEEGERSLYRLAIFAALIGMSLAWLSLRSLRLTLIVFACGVLSAIASLSIVWLTRGTTDAFLLSMPSLVYVLAVSGALHLIKYYRDSVSESGIEGAPANAIRLGWKPTLLCSVTTAMGLLSLYTSELTPIRKFGMYSSIGVMLMLVTLFVFLPAALYVWPMRVRSSSKRLGRLAEIAKRLPKRKFLTLDEFWQRFGAWIVRRYAWVTFACFALTIAVGLGLSYLRTNIDLMKLFDGQSRIRQDYQWLEANVGRLVPMEVVIKFDKELLHRDDNTMLDHERYTLLQRAETVATIQSAIDKRFGSHGADIVGQSLSPVTFIPSMPSKSDVLRTKVRRSVVNSKLKQSYESLCTSGYLTTDPSDGAELWRISVRVAAFKDVDYGQFTNQLRDFVDPFIARQNRRLTSKFADVTIDSPVLSAVYTGVVPIIYKAQRGLLDSLIQSTFWSFITITPLLMLVSRGFWPGAVAMIPNALPVLVVFGGMGWLGVPVAIGSMMSASIALGVAVDDTIHFLMWFRTEFDRTSDRRAACLAAYRRCASPTLQAALISGLGLSVFAFSTFTPTKQFGLLMLTILIAGVIAELVMIPALLAGPLGQAFEPRRKKNVAPVELQTPKEKPTIPKQASVR